ncbi:MAG: hypothetical protein AB8B66_03615 [Rickettsiaceae bacterium]
MNTASTARTTVSSAEIQVLQLLTDAQKVHRNIVPVVPLSSA